MRILWLSPYVPSTTFGGGTRVYNLLKILAENCEIDLIAGSLTGEPTHEMEADLRSLCRTVHVVPAVIASRPLKRLLQLKSLVGQRPMQHRIFHSSAMQDAISASAQRNTYDVVILESSFMGYYVLPDALPRVLDQHNVESEILQRSGQRERSAVRRAYNWLEYAKYHADERRICQEANLIFATSTRDCDTMQRWPDLPPCVVIPNGVDSTWFQSDVGEDSQSASVLFTGTMNYSPNVEAMLYFAGEIWPLIQQRIPDAVLRIVGRTPPPEITRLNQMTNVIVVGSVPDIRPYLASAQVVVAPLRIGGGTRLKILEAMAMTRPVVCTTLACEGLDVQDGRHVLVADDAPTFAERVCDLLCDPARRAEIGLQGRQLVQERYDWRELGRRMERSLRDVVETARTERQRLA